MATIWNVRQLRVYQRALSLLPLLYEVAYSVPESHRKQRRQLINSGEAIAPLITEGFSKRRNEKEVKRFFEMAMAESDEIVAHLHQVLILANRFRTIRRDLAKRLIDEYTIESKELFNLIKKWNKGIGKDGGAVKR